MRLRFPSTAASRSQLVCRASSGDVVLCPAVVGTAWRAPVVHAVLHLLGYDHGAEMESRERAHA